MLNLEPIKKRLAAASPMPWWRVATPDRNFIDGFYFGPEPKTLAEIKKGEWLERTPGGFYDADFVENATIDIPALVKEVEELREIISRYEKTDNDIKVKAMRLILQAQELAKEL